MQRQRPYGHRRSAINGFTIPEPVKQDPAHVACLLGAFLQPGDDNQGKYQQGVDQ